MSNKQKYSKKKPNSVLIDADFRIKIEKAIENFVFNSNSLSYEFPASLTNVERAFVHNLAPKFNLTTKSIGKDENRKLSLFKLTENCEFANRSVKIELDPSALTLLRQFQKDCPPIDKTRTNLHQPSRQENRKPFVLSKAPTVPAQSNADARVQNQRTSLPIYSIRDRILNAIDEHRIVLIQGSTGSGKTTQIPQFILENANERNQPCRILCTQPRRISAIASADRVCYERSESNSSTIGYQIRLESSISQDTNCIFLTPGVFLRYLISGDPKTLFNNITHILIDEAHERAKENDFLLTSIKEHFNANPNLKLIIMSATMDTAVFKNYFGSCEEISIAIKQYEVQEFYLEDILKGVNYTNSRVTELNKMLKSGELVTSTQSAYVQEQNSGESDAALDRETVNYLNEVLGNMSTSETPENEFDQFVYLVQAENVPVDFRHATTKMTALMIAVGRGYLAQVDMLLKLKADPKLKVVLRGNELNCLDIAVEIQGIESDIKKLVEHYYLANGDTKVLSSMDVYNKNLLNIYYDTMLKTKSNNFVIEEGIDHELIAQLIDKIHNTANTDEAILVFLPGYEDITQLANLIKDRLRNDFSLFLLHSSMKTEDQKNVFKPVMYGQRKIILSTNIAESSITIDDVVFVIDSGREKQKSYDAISHSSSLRVQWISKASANQRRGRAGRLRNGYVYRVYSNDRYSSMLETTLPELLRTSLTEICLQTKLMISDTMKIEEFLQKCIASPAIASIRQSIKFLQCLGALNQNEELTLLGIHLAQMPVDAKYAKMLIYGIALKCLNPVLSIVSILSMGDQIFVLPFKPADRFKSHQVKRNLGGESMSDHFVMLKLFQLWMNLRQNNMNDRKFCEDNFISSSSMEHVKGIRSQIMSYLTSSGLLKASSNVLNTNSNNWPLIKACLCAGLYPNVARVDRKKKAMYSDIDQKLVFHMSSILGVKNERSMDFVKHFPADWIVFEEKNRVGRMSMIRCNTLLNSFSLSLSAGASLKSEMEHEYDDEDDEEAKLVIKIDNLVTFTAGNENGSLMLDLRQNLDDLILRLLSMRNFKFEQNDDKMIETIARVLEIEDRNSGFATVSFESNGEVQSSKNNFQQWRSNQNDSQAQSRQQNGFNPRSNSQYFAGNADRSENRPTQNGFNQRNPKPATGKFFSSNTEQNSNQQSWRQPVSSQSSQPSANKSEKSGNRPAQRQQNGSNQRNQFFDNNAGPSRSSSNRQSNFQPPSSNRKKFFVLQMNNERTINDWATKIVFDVELLNLKQFMMQKFSSMGSTQVIIIFYSTTRNEFLGYGEIMPATNRTQMQFHFKLVKKLSLEKLRQSAGLNLNLFQNSSYQTEELSDDIGRTVVDSLHS